MSPGLIIASARLPVTLARRSDGWEASPSPGGLVSALRMVMQRSPFQWLGWPGTFVPESERDAVRRELRLHHATPVFIEEQSIEGFHHGYSSQTLWPLLHGRVDRTRFDSEAWHHYCAVNQAFAVDISDVASGDDLVWVHDYQLSLVPRLLREASINHPVGFFLHTPFPPCDVFRYLPQRNAVLEGLLGADVIGFQSYEYAHHFRQAACRLLGASLDDEALLWEGRRIEVRTSPVGVDPLELRELGTCREARQELAALQTTYAGRKLIASVDRFDYTKGIPEKLRAYESLLERYPQLRGRVVLVQVAQPSRATIHEYQLLKSEVDELVGRINGRFGSASFMPVVYVSQTTTRARIAALYRAAECALITPLIDGMNLVALEYIAARGDREGQLVLSEFTGAAQFLPGVRLVNPHDTVGTADALADVLQSTTSQSEAFGWQKRFVESNTAIAWAEGFIERLASAPRADERSREHYSPQANVHVQALRSSDSKAVLFGDGVLLGRDGQLLTTRLSALASLSRRVRVCGLSGQARSTIDSWGLPPSVGFLAEWGNVYRSGEGDWTVLGLVDDSSLRSLVEPLLLNFVRHVPGSQLDFGAGSAVWRYGKAVGAWGALQTRLLIPLLEARLRGQPYLVRRHHHGIEICHSGLDLRRCAREGHRLHADADWVLFLGAPGRDRDLFLSLRELVGEHVTLVSVNGPTALADWWLEGTDDIVGALEAVEALLAQRP